jgi:hypothetical protein
MGSFKKFMEPSYADIHQAMMEADKKLPEHSQIQEGAMQFHTGKIETDSTHPAYDKRSAYAMYGTPEENKEGSAANIAAHEKKTGRKASATHQKILKAFKHNPNGTGGISKLFHHYGAADPKLISSEDRKKEAEDNFREFSERRKNNPTEYKKHVTEMRAKGLGKVIDEKTKTDTVSSLPGNDKDEHKGHITYGFGGNPDTRRHYTDRTGKFVTGNACHGKGNCVNDCLAKNGCGGFDTTKGHRDSYDQRSSHNAASRKDHDLELFHSLHEAAKKAKKEKKGVVVRPDVTTGHQHTEYANAISEHFGPNSEGVKSGTHAPVHTDTYGKMIGTEKDPHSKAKGINTAISMQGYPKNRRDVEAHKTALHLLRQKGENARVAYGVMRTKHHQDNADGTEKTHNNPKDEEHWKKTMSVEKTRLYDIHPSKPGAGDGEDPNEKRAEYHNEDKKHGRVVRKETGADGKTTEHSHFYSDHRNPAPIKDVNGKYVPTSYHDGRGLEIRRHIADHPKEHGIIATSPATASTHFDEDHHKGSIFFDPAHIDSNHVHHILHPDSEEAAHARSVG